METLVLKFGGTSVGDLARIRDAASLVARERNQPGLSRRIVVVVSAMAGETARLQGLGRSVPESPSPPDPLDLADQDQILATGEQVTSALMAMALRSLSVPARALLGWQVPVETDANAGGARILEVGTDLLEALLAQGRVPVISGFQGVSPEGRITTIGRGGSDLSAVAVAAALKADRCDIYTDVEGIYTADPRVVGCAQRLKTVFYDEMLEMASLGSRVLQARSVQLAYHHGVPVRVVSTFRPGAGTRLVGQEAGMEEVVVRGVVCSPFEARITLGGIPDRPGQSARLFTALGQAGINVDMIVQSSSTDGQVTDMTFTLARTDVAGARQHIEPLREPMGFRSFQVDSNVSKVSIVGVGMRSQSGVAARMFQAVAAAGINLLVISTSEIRVSVLIDESRADEAVRAIHNAFGLEQPSGTLHA